ncbi:Rne/Rng family ribonuclease [Propionibacterium australiense]|uniref:Rne/Rng family ribonuclease n=1 Tax=Propionibacterium australiense TaxID=119981 RepID=UPI000EF1E71F|nr:Rne/Rng family ribonuclease [Propionibacterium australiense]RLP11003.1 Rne/Rng family ribonuclease [Propionibacterium australiense]VEH90990.1 Ribonuclease G [Propionibacterium australiense]
MLDDTMPDDATVSDDLPRPPRGRRAKTRPAGPPQAIAEPETTPGPADAAAESAAEEPGEDLNPAEPAEQLTEPAGQGEAVDETAEAGEPEQAPAPGTGTERFDPVAAAIAAVMDEVAADRAAERAMLEAGPEPPALEGAAGSQRTLPVPAERSAAEQGTGEQKPARRRSSSTRSAQAETAAGEQGPAEPDSGEEQDRTEPSSARGRRRRTVAAEDASAADQVDALLAEAEREAASRAPRPGAAGEEVDKQAVLDSLTAAIAGDQQPRTETGTQDGPEAESLAPGEPEDGAGRSGETQDGPAEGSDDAEEEQPARRRRRRRGGRRRHRGPGAGSDEDGSESESDERAEAGRDESKDTETDAAESGQGQHRRRRRRRRRGEDTGGSDDDPSDVVVRVREPRHSAVDEVTGIEGSTRLEAKRQRRKEGRAAGRRRAPILTEAEFLARRESVNRKMVIRQREEYTQLAVLEDDVLVEHYVDRKASASLIGNIYLGKVQNVLPSMEAAFIDIGRGRNAVLYAGEVNWDALVDKSAPHTIETALKPGQAVLVQVSKDPIGAKGARLTAHVSLPGRYVVYSPDGHLSGISRKLPDTERRRLREIINEAVDESSSVIVRTAAEGVSADDLRRDVERLKAQWEVIEKKVAAGNAPQQLYAEPDLTLRIVRDVFTEDFAELVVAGDGGPNDAFDTIEAYVEHVAPNLRDRLKRWDGEQGDPFAEYRIDEQISKALERKVFLPSGGSLVIDRTEAMTVIDVNTGKFTGSGGNLEETVTKNNLEAAEEIVRQLRLRDLGGIVVIDFIDMVLPANRELLLRRLVECLGRDRTRHQVSEVTSLGLVQLTRKRIGTGLAEAFTVECEACGGRGYIRHDEPVASQAPADGGERHRRGRRGGGKKKSS